MLDIINTRRSVRKFKNDPVDQQDIHDLLEAAMNAPSAGNEQAWQFIILSGKVLDDLLKINKNTAKGAPVAILICQDIAVEKAKGYSVQDCAAATQNILLAAHTKGLGAVWTTVFPDNVKAVRTLLNVPDNILPFACIPIGYSAEGEKKSASRFDEKKVHYQSWGHGK
jgi:nitroreductase